MVTSGITTSIAQGLGTAQRATEVARLLARFGFGEFLIQTGLGNRSKPPEHDADAEIRAAPLAERVRLLLEALGPTFVKAGQILSTRPDLIPVEWTKEFRKLQSQVPPDPWEGRDGEGGVKQVLAEAYGEELESRFESIDEEAFAAASMAQVHRAVLRCGERVVLKVLRPGTRARMHADLDLMRMLARATKSWFDERGVDPVAVVDEFSKQLERETDLSIEAASTARMRQDFIDDRNVHFPRVWRELSNRDVLCLEEIHGTLLSRLDVESLSDERRAAIVRHGADAVFRQCLVVGFFHADPHPGNIFVLEDDSVCFIDCGMTGLIDPGSVDELASLVHGTINQDLDRIVKTALRLGGADPRMAEDRTFRSDVWRFIDHFQGGSLESIRMGRLLDDFFSVLRRHGLHCPADIVYLIKAMSTIESVAAEVAPSFDLVAHLQPYVERLIRRRYSVTGLRQRFEAAAVDYGDLVEKFPGELKDLLTAIRQNRLSLQLDHQGFDRLTDEIERSSMNISWSLVIASVIVGGSVLVLADSLDRDASILSTMASISVALAVIIGILRMIRLRFLR